MLQRTGLMAAMLLALALPSLARGQDSPTEDTSTTDEDRSKLLYTNGKALYEEGAYQQAAQAFEEAYAVSHNPVLLFNISNAWERSGDLGKAIDYLNQYRIYATPEESDKLTRRLGALERRFKDEAKAGSLNEEPQPPPPQPLPLPAPATTKRSPLGPILTVSGAALVVGFGVVAGVTYLDSRTYLDSGDRDSYDALRPLNNASTALAGVGGGLMLTGLVVAALRGSPTEAHNAQLGASLSPDSVQLNLILRSW